MADDRLMGQDESERLLNAGRDQAASASAPQPSDADAAAQPRTAEAAGARATSTARPEQASQDGQVPGNDDQPLDQEGIEKLLQQAGQALTRPTSQPPAPKHAPPDPGVPEGIMLPDDVDYLLRQAEQALESVNTAAAGDFPQGVSAFRLEEFSGAPASTENTTFDLIRDVELDLRIELGRTHMYLEDVLKLCKGSVVPLDKLAGDPVDIYVNGRLIARGEVLVLSDNFCVRVAELIAGTSVSA